MSRSQFRSGSQKLVRRSKVAHPWIQHAHSWLLSTPSSSALFQRTILRVREFSLPFLQLPSARYGKAPGTRDQYHRSQLTSVMPYLVHRCLATAESAKVQKKLRGWHVLLFIHFSSSSSFFFLHEKQRTRRRNTVSYKAILFHTHFYSILAACNAQDQLQL